MINKFADAIYLTFENAKSLFEEATILEKHNKTSRAYTLYHLCFEECGRFQLLHSFFIEYLQGDIKPKDFNFGKLKKMGYESHEIKISQSFYNLYIYQYVTQRYGKDQVEFEKTEKELLEQLRLWQSQESEINRLKNVSLYVTFRDNEFHSPDTEIMLNRFVDIKKLAQLGLSITNDLIRYFDSKGGYQNLKEAYDKNL
jgi:AbiV family abortive infection protein